MAQQELPYPTGQGQWIEDIRDLNIRSMPAKMLLLVIDSHIPPKRGSWDMKPEDLARECAMHKVTYYRAVKLLTEAGLLSVEEAAFPDRRRYRIVRSTISEEAERCREDATYELCIPAPRNQALRSEIDQSVAEGNSPPVAEGNSAVAEGNSAVAEGNSSPLTRPKQKTNSAKQKRGSAGADDFVLPEALDCAPFRDAWSAWLAFRREKRKAVTRRAAEMQLKKLAAWGVPRAVSAIEHSIAQDYQGIFEPTPAHSGQTQDRANGRVHGKWKHDGFNYIDL